MTETRLRVLHVTPSFAPAYRYGGPIQSLEGLTVELVRQGVEVRVVTTDAHGPERLALGRGWLRHRDVPVRYLPRWLPPDLAPGILGEAFLESRRADVVHVTAVFNGPSIAGLLAAFAARAPVVLSPRGTVEPEALSMGPAARKRRWLSVFGPLFHRVSCFHATSDTEAESIKRAFGSEARVRVVPNGTRFEPRAEAESRKERSARPLRIGALGRVHPKKNLEALVDAARVLRGRGLEVELSFAGPLEDRRYADAVVARAREARVPLELVGEIAGDAKLDFLASCRVLGFPSTTENFGNVVIEALAAFTPVVASRGTPWAELEAKGAGRWVEARPDDLADAIAPFVRDDVLAQATGQRGRSLVEERYTWAAVARQMTALYGELARAR